jgi:autotransporter adhesin
VGSSGAERQIQNVAAGDVSASSTDAVNGSQLNATNSNVINLTTRMSTAETNILNLQGEFGGGITFTGNTGSKKADLNTTFNIKGEGTKEDSEYSGSNIKTVVDGNTLTIKMDENPSFTSVTATSIIAGSGSSKVLINNTGISVGGNTYISSTGINANNQVITNVASGSATAGSTDAVNGTQLYETNQAVAKNAQDIANINNGYNILDNKIDKVGAGAAALAGLHPLEFDPTDRFSMSTGLGTYRGEHALAMGAFYRPTESTMYSVGSELGNSNNMWTVGVSFKFGADKTNPASRSNIVRELLQLKAENKAIKADNMAMKAELSEIKQQLALLIQKK